MPLYISNTNRVETVQGELEGRGSNSTTTTTLVPPQLSYWWGKSGNGINADFTYMELPCTLGNVIEYALPEPYEFTPALRACNEYNNTITAGGGDGNQTFRSPFGVDFEVYPSPFGYTATFTNSFPSSSENLYMLASYIPPSGSTHTFEFVPPNSSITRCVTYPAYTFFSTGSSQYDALFTNFSGDCGVTIDCECEYCYHPENSPFSGSAPCGVTI